MSCSKAQAVFNSKKIEISAAADARKEKIEADEAWELLQDASEILVAKGKKILQLAPKLADKDTLLASILGPSGTLRAPTIKIGSKFLVGYNDELYSENF